VAAHDDVKGAAEGGRAEFASVGSRKLLRGHIDPRR
jgi:hypothetical protein